MQSGEKMFTVDKFLGVNESADGYTELKMGEASAIENFSITDGLNLKLRPGVQRMDFAAERDPAQILSCWAGFISEGSSVEYLVIVDFKETDRIWAFTRQNDGGYAAVLRQEGAIGLSDAENHMVKIFPFGGKLWIMSRANTVSFSGESFQKEDPYVPLVIAGAAPSGGGTMLEGINMLTNLRRIDYSSDGASTGYVLPEEALSVVKIIVDNVPGDIEALGAFDGNSHTFTFNVPPEKGVGNVEFTYMSDPAASEKTRLLIASMPLVEAFNGSTDTRIFFGGSGNTCYYTGVTQDGQATPMYFPSVNHAKIDMAGASVTGLVRHFGKLLVFTRDGTYTLSYEPVTMEDGSTTAGFYLRSINRGIGSDVVGQVQTVNNYPRTVTSDGIYEWRIAANTRQDERYAQRVSDRVQRTFMAAKDIQRFVTCDNNFDRTYYVFLNDREGTVLVSRYGLAKEDIWTVYKGDIFKDVRRAFIFDGTLFFDNGSEVFRFSESAAKDVQADHSGGSQAIHALWESGYMDFGADFRRKFSSEIYVSMLPDSHSEMTITAQTDRRDAYTEKTVSGNLFSFRNLSFPVFTFDVNNTPKIRRIRLKAKKFVYYKLIFRVDAPGAKATVLRYDQKIRFGSMAK